MVEPSATITSPGSSSDSKRPKIVCPISGEKIEAEERTKHRSRVHSHSLAWFSGHDLQHARTIRFGHVALMELPSKRPGTRPTLAHRLESNELNLTLGHEVNAHGSRPRHHHAAVRERGIAVRTREAISRTFETQVKAWRPWNFGPAHGLATGAMVGSTNQAPIVFTLWFGADAKLLSVLAIIAQLYDAINAIPFARSSDQGLLNKTCCSLGPVFPLQKWGRRAPYAVIGAPFFSLGILMCWIGGKYVGTLGAALWFGLAKFVLANGMTMTYLASTSSLYELYQDKLERVPVLSSRIFWTQVGCAVGLGLTMQVAMRVEPGHHLQDPIFAAVGIAQAMMLLPVWCCSFIMMPKTPLKDTSCLSQGVSWRATLARTLPNPGVWYLAGGTIFLYGSMNIVGLVPFFLKFTCNIKTASELANAQLLLGVGHGLGRVLFLPLQTRIVTRYHPPYAAACAAVLCALLVCPLLIICAVLEIWWPTVIVWFLLAGGWGLSELSLTTMLGWVIDADQVLQTEKAGRPQSREDGMFWSLYSFMQAAAQIFASLGLLVFSLSGFDSQSAKEGAAQPRAAVLSLSVYFIAGFTVCSLIVAACMVLFPLKGQRLHEVETKYRKIMDELSSRPVGDSASILPDAGGDCGSDLPATCTL